jgi:hypothetical protein
VTNIKPFTLLAHTAAKTIKPARKAAEPAVHETAAQVVQKATEASGKQVYTIYLPMIKG